MKTTSKGQAAGSEGKGQSQVNDERLDMKDEDGETGYEEGGPKKRKANGFTKQIMYVASSALFLLDLQAWDSLALAWVYDHEI